jgi:hypothetical protein
MQPKPTLPWTLASVFVLSLAGCYSNAWIGDLLGESETEGAGDCVAGDLQCTDDGVEACVDGSWVVDRSNLGCEFMAASLPTNEIGAGQVTIGLTNSGNRSASVTLAVAGVNVGAAQVEPGSAAQLAIPWNPAVGSPSASVNVAGGGVVLTSDQPVAAFLFNRGDAASVTSDASTLLPRHVWGDDYYAVTNPHFVSPFTGEQGAGFWAALSTEPVALTVAGGPRTQLAAGAGLDVAGNGNVSLGAGGAVVAVTQSSGVAMGSCGWAPASNFYGCGRPPLADPSGALPLACAPTPAVGSACMGQAAFIGCCAPDGTAYYCNTIEMGTWVQESCPPLADGSDLSGARIRGDRPFAAFGGHSCANVPSYKTFCDHLEEQLWPSERAGDRFAVIAPSFDGAAKSYLLRVLAIAGPVDLTFTPPVPQAPNAIAGAGEYVDVWVATDMINPADFILDASGPIEVVQLSFGDEGGLGDPSMLLTPSLDQGRREMAFFVPSGFSTISVTLVGPPGTEVTVDGNTVTLTSPLGPEHAYSRVQVPAKANGYHSVRATNPVTATVFARNASPEPNTTLWYLAGVNEPGE